MRNPGGVRQHGEILVARKVQLFHFIRGSRVVTQSSGILSSLVDFCFYDASTPSVLGKAHN